MPAQKLPLLTFNRGLVSDLGLARQDIARVRLSASLMTNWTPRVLGSMQLRPGLGFVGEIDGVAKMLPFIFATDDTALIELTDEEMRVWVEDELVTRPSVTAAVTNGTFTANVTGWTDADEVGAISQFDAGGISNSIPAGGYLRLEGDNDSAAIRHQTVTVNEPNIEHGLRVIVTRGPVEFAVGTTSTDDSYINLQTLPTGIYSFGFTPTGNFNVRFRNQLPRAAFIDSCEVEGAGVMVLPSPIQEADLPLIRFDQSGAVMFLAIDGYTQRRIARRTSRSWSIEQYLADDGPWRIDNTTNVTILPTSAEKENGGIALSASAPVFRPDHGPSLINAGAIFRVRSKGQRVSRGNTVGRPVARENAFTDAIRVSGIDTLRDVIVVVAAVSAGTVVITLQRSADGPDGPWTDITTFTGTTTTVFNDTFDNSIFWYRIGTTSYTSGTWTFGLSTATGSITGIGRVTNFQDSMNVAVEVIQTFSTTASDDWTEGEWSDLRGWPTALAFHDGRLGFAGKSKLQLSVSDAFASFDDDVEGDSGPINRSIGTGPVDTINWLLSLERLIVGAQGAEWSARTSALDEPLTPTGFSLKAAATQGSAAVQAVKIDRTGAFVQKSKTRLFELNMAADPNATDYGVVDLTQIVPEVGQPSIVSLAVQRQPDTRVHCVLSDGTVALLVIDRTENALCWLKIDTDRSTGFAADVLDVVVLPGTVEDQVYYVVQRTVDGNTVQYLEKWALESECVGGVLNKQADSFVTYTGAAATVITGLDHLEGRQVCVWANGFDVGTDQSLGDGTWTHLYTVTGGSITLAVAATNVVVGLPYKAQWKSSKLALSDAAGGTSLTNPKRISEIGVILKSTHAQGLFFGRDFTHMDGLPLRREAANVDPDSILTVEDKPVPFPGDWATDSRLCLEARSPRPCNILAAIVAAESHG